jgi:hypothetical protein
MIDHERFLMLAAADVSGELNEAERAELESHVASCPSCRQEAARMWLDQRALVAASAEVPVPAATRAAVVAAIRQRPARAIWPGLAAAALLIIALAGTAFVAGSRAPAVAPDSPAPSLTPSRSPSAPPSPPVMSINGAYAYLTSSGAERRDSVSVRDTDPISGTWSRFVPPDGASVGGPVTCLEIDGQDAWLAGPATEDSDGETWRAALLFVHDSGRAGGEGDLAVAWITDPGQSLDTMEGWCRDHYTPAGPFPLTEGDIVIQQSP